jgi:hypothetical protein
MTKPRAGAVLLAALALTATLGLAGCQNRAVGASHDTGRSSTGQQIPGPANQGSTGGSGAGAVIDTGVTDADLTTVDGLLGDLDTQLGADGAAPADAD